MRECRNGFVLFVFLVYMQALLLFILLSFEVVSKDFIRASLAVKMAGIAISAKGLLRKLEQQNSTCGLVAMSSSRKLKQAPHSWWAVHACVGYDHTNKFFFVRELIDGRKPSDINLHVKHVDRYDIYRNTLLYESGVNLVRSALLQSTTQFKKGMFSGRLTSRALW